MTLTLMLALVAVWLVVLMLAAFAAGRSVGYVAGLNYSRRVFREALRDLEGGGR